MIKVYRKTATIKAEQFDGRDEMIVKYGIEKERSVYPDGGFNYFIPPTRNKRVSTLDWIIIDANGAVSVLGDDDFKQQYAELPVIPKEVAEYLEIVRQEETLFGALDEALAGVSDLSLWIAENQDDFARAWLGGYTVEEDHE
ncbi:MULTISPECIES: DUF1642 domain-containing protein [Lactiplantibacillus]|uniref:DUF1642 domain-containing protein n=1 Tax=Lactiplantibacillus argentoratensis TaxID=271881 RepID=A0ABS5UGI5_9LACO|nr:MULTISPECIES: DUF1642 domain-containing protein [Lactiplantibacillus]MBT1137689.1 DUF1642 domain-containing protein [Lactiplantibacillus argentoratensis]MBT1140547.1 DUF1642 domain-containing protein [Lactiplantibacillus argentoratensis]